MCVCVCVCVCVVTSRFFSSLKMKANQSVSQLAFTRYRHYQYCKDSIAIQDGRGETLIAQSYGRCKGGGGCTHKGVFANKSIDYFTKASNKTNIL